MRLLEVGLVEIATKRSLIVGDGVTENLEGPTEY
jgi:hypothetical protein